MRCAHFQKLRRKAIVPFSRGRMLCAIDILHATFAR